MTTILKDEQPVESLTTKYDWPVLDDKVIPLWLIVFDQDPTRAYICNSKDKVLASVEGAIRSACGEDSDVLVKPIIDQIDKTWGQSFISLRCPPALDLFVHHLEIDKHNVIGKTLLECYEAIPYDSLRAKIARLFVDP